METENSNQQTPQSATTNQSFIPPSSPSQSKRFILISAIIIALLAFGIGGYVLGTRKNESASTYKQSPGSTSVPTVQTSPTSIPTEIPAQETSTLPADWTLKLSTTCNVKMPLPPKKAPYYFEYNPNRAPSVTNDEGSGRYWQFEEYEAGMFIFKTTARAIFRTPEEASGYVSGDVEVICAPNTVNYTTDSLIAKLESDFSKVMYTAPDTAESNPDAIKIKSKRESIMWGRKVWIVKFQGGMFGNDDHYIFATNKNIYLVRKVARSQNQTVQDTTTKIFTNLQFLSN